MGMKNANSPTGGAYGRHACCGSKATFRNDPVALAGRRLLPPRPAARRARSQGGHVMTEWRGATAQQALRRAGTCALFYRLADGTPVICGHDSPCPIHQRPCEYAHAQSACQWYGCELPAPIGSLAQILHDIAHPQETDLKAGGIYQTIAERLVIELREGGAELYEWLADRARAGQDPGQRPAAATIGSNHYPPSGGAE